MDSDLLQRFSKLPNLNDNVRLSRDCKVCGHPAGLFDVVDFNKFCSAEPYHYGLSGIPVPYFRCPQCELIFTDLIDDWSHEDVSRFIYNEDYVLVDPEYLGDRPRRTAVHLASIMKGCESLPILDYGSGSGIFADEMRKAGFHDIVSYDPFSSPERPSRRFAIVTCFEVVEHSPKPLETFQDMEHFLEPDGSLIVGQTLQPDNIKEIGGRWWYLAPRNGHVSTYSEQTFLTIAAKLNMVYRRGGGLFTFDRRQLNEIVLETVQRIGQQINWVVVGAPEDGKQDQLWHHLEYAGAERFRWTADAEVLLSRVFLNSGVNEIRVPYLMEVHANFAKACRLTCNGEPLPTRCDGASLSADVSVSSGNWIDIGLQTPPLISPRALRNDPDGRPLGLAVRVNRTG